MIGIGFATVQALGAAGQLASGILSSNARQAEFAEQLRQLEAKKTYTLSLTSALAGASGVESSSVSTNAYLRGMTNEFDKQLEYLRSVKSAVGTADLIGNISGLVGAGAQTFGGLGQLNNMWQMPKVPGSDGAALFAKSTGWKPGGV